MPRSRESRQAAGRIGGLVTAATTDGPTRTQPARDARLQQFLDLVPAQFTDPADRLRRAELLRRAHMIRLSERARLARVQQRAARHAQKEAEAELAHLTGEYGDEVA